LYLKKNLLLFSSQCSFCDKRFTISATLERHQFVFHGVAPYACPECGEAFSGKTALVAHALTHGRTAPYGCKRCGESFECLLGLRGHAMKHRRMKPYAHLSYQKHKRLRWPQSEERTLRRCGRHLSLAGTLRDRKRSCTESKNDAAVPEPVRAAAGEASQPGPVDGSEVETMLFFNVYSSSCNARLRSYTTSQPRCFPFVLISPVLVGVG